MESSIDPARWAVERGVSLDVPLSGAWLTYIFIGSGSPKPNLFTWYKSHPKPVLSFRFKCIVMPSPNLLYITGTHFTNDFSITIQIRWKFHLALIQLLMTISQQNLANCTTAQLSCNVPNIVAITLLVFGWEQNEIFITFELWWKNC